MPTFRTTPSSSLTSAVRRLVASSSGVSPLDEMKVDAAAADTARNMSLAEKARAEVQAMQQESAMRADPNVRTEFAAHSAGIDLPAATQLSRAIRGEMDPNPQGPADAADNVYGDVPVARPEGLQPGQERMFRSALAAAMANTLGTGKTNAEQLTAAAGNVQGQSITEAVQDAIRRKDFDAASAMNQGGKLGNQVKVYENVGNTGALFAPGSGTVNADPAAQPDNALLRSTLDQGSAQIERDRAAADASRAQAEKARKEKDDLGKAPTGYRWGAPDENGNPTLVPIAGGPAEKLGEQQVKQLVGVKNTRDAISEYRKALKNFSIVELMQPNERARMATVYRNMLMQAKEAYNLGVLNGPDFEILQSIVTDPTSWQSTFITRGALDDQAKTLEKIMERIALTVDSASKQRGTNAGAPGGAAPEATKVIGGVTYVKVNGKWFQQ